MTAKKRYEQASRLLGFQRPGSLVCARDNEPPSAVAVEVHSAIARLHRLGKLNDLGKLGALSRLNLLSRGWREILPGDPVRDLAMRLLDGYELRAADSFQLAAALIWCQQRPLRRAFVCADQRLSNAAKSAGFTVFELSRVVP